MQLFFLIGSTAMLLLAVGVVLALFLVVVCKVSRRATYIRRLSEKIREALMDHNRRTRLSGMEKIISVQPRLARILDYAY